MRSESFYSRCPASLLCILCLPSASAAALPTYTSSSPSPSSSSPAPFLSLVVFSRSVLPTALSVLLLLLLLLQRLLFACNLRLDSHLLLYELLHRSFLFGNGSDRCSSFSSLNKPLTLHAGHTHTILLCLELLLASLDLAQARLPQWGFSLRLATSCRQRSSCRPSGAHILGRCLLHGL